MRRNKFPYKDMSFYTSAVSKDDEGNPIKCEDAQVTFTGYMYPATDEVQVKIYGDQINSISNLIIKDTECKIKRKDTVLYDGIKYSVESIKPYTTHLLIEVRML